MGGYGSGRYGMRAWKKTTVEDCRSLDVGCWVREGIIAPGVVSSGGWQWTRGGKSVASIGYESRCDQQPAFIRLHYTCNNTEQLDYRVDLDRTRLTFGWRWWFRCPNAHCGRRVGKLYLVGKMFLCRECGGLTYESRQENRRSTDRLCGIIGAELGITGKEVRKIMRKEREL